MRYPLLLLICLMLCAGVAARDTANPQVRAFSSAAYGGGVQNWAITQDAHGIIYVANSVGVLQYDGVRWQTIALPGHPTVRTVRYVAGRIYAGGYGAFGYFETTGPDALRWHSLAEQLPDQPFNEEIWNIEVLTDGRVVFQSFGRLFVYDGETVETIRPPGVMMFVAARPEGLLVPVTGRGLYAWDAERDFRFLPGSEVLGAREVVGMQPLDGQRTLVATEDAVFVLGPAGLTVWDAALNEQLRGRKINRLLVMTSGLVAIGTITSGVYLFDPEEKSTQRLDEDSGISNNTVLGLFESEADKLWLALDRGLNMVNLSRALRYPSGNEQPQGAVYAAAHYGGRDFIGTNQGLYWWDAGRKRYALVTGTAGQVWKLTPTRQGLLCGHNRGLLLVKDTTATLVSNRSGGWDALPLPDRPGWLLQSTYTGLQLVIPDGGSFRTDGIAGLTAPIRYLSQTGRRSFLALHGSRGAYRFDLSEDYEEMIRIDTINHPGLVKARLEQFGDTLLIQSQTGVYHYQKGELIPIREFRGVELRAGDYCLAGRVARQEWFLCRADRVMAFRGRRKVTDFALRLRFPYPVVIPWETEDYLLLLDEGYARVSVRAEENSVPDLLLRAVCNGPDGSRALGSDQGTPTLRYADNDLVFTYALPVYDRPISYRSRLIGYGGGEWSDWSATGQRVFTSLPAGEYTFEVEANWFGKIARQRFYVQPPWYGSWWAMVLYALAVLVLGRWLYHLHKQRLQRQARKLEIVRQRELQRERMVARNRALSADVRRKSQELANTTLTLAKKNEILLTLKEEVDKARRQGGLQINHRKIDHLIDRNLNNKEDWAIFESHFNEVHEVFLKQLQQAHPTLTTGDLKLAAYLRMDLSSKEIAPLLHISVRGVENKRYRLRKKLGLSSGDDLNGYLIAF